MTPAMQHIPSYPGMEHMPAILGKQLYTIQADGHFQPVSNINQRFRNELERFHIAYHYHPQRFLLATVLPPQPEVIWKRSASLLFTGLTFSRLNSLECMLTRLTPKIARHSHALTREMSVYAGMRRLNMYGLLLGMHPIITLQDDGQPVAVNLRSTSLDASETSFQRHLKALSLASLFSAGLPERNFVNGVFQLYDAVGSH